MNSYKSQLLTTSQQLIDKHAIRDCMKYQGVQIRKDKTRITSKNYKPLLSDIRKYLARWNLLAFPGIDPTC